MLEEAACLPALLICFPTNKYTSDTYAIKIGIRHHDVDQYVENIPVSPWSPSVFLPNSYAIFIILHLVSDFEVNSDKNRESSKSTTCSINCKVSSQSNFSYVRGKVTVQ